MSATATKIMETSQPTMQFHPVADLFPLMTATEFSALRDDIAANGLREAIWTHDGQIIDGRNRYNACVELGTEPKYRTWDGSGSLVAFVVSLNLTRRHLSESQRSLVAAKLANLNSVGRPATDTANLRNISQATAAELLNISERSVSSAAKVYRDGVPELIAEVEAGQISVSAAADLAEMPKYRQKRIIKKGRNATKKIIGKIRERAIVTATRGGRVCVVCGPNIEDTETNFLAAIQLVGKQFPAHQRFLTDVIEELAQTELSEETRGNYELILTAIRAGNSEQTDCRRAAGLDWDKFDVTISQMIDHGMIDVRTQGGKTDNARGARKRIYVILDRPMPEPKEDLEYDEFDDGWGS